VGVGYNGSAENRRALALMRDFASAHSGVTMRALTSTGPTPAAQAPAPPAPAELDGIEIDAVHDDLAHALERFSEQLDLLIIGSRKSEPRGHLLHSGAAAHLARCAQCPLIVTSS
jgi:hypothetical protein